MRRLRVLSEHPHLGKPNDVREEFDGAQAYIDAGFAEWVTTRAVTVIETTEELVAPETTVTRHSPRKPPDTVPPVLGAPDKSPVSRRVGRLGDG